MGWGMLPLTGLGEQIGCLGGRMHSGVGCLDVYMYIGSQRLSKESSSQLTE